jgi:hypothetical protein
MSWAAARSALSARRQTVDKSFTLSAIDEADLQQTVVRWTVRHYLDENIAALDVRLTAKVLPRIKAIFPAGAAGRTRTPYHDATWPMING